MEGYEIMMVMPLTTYNEILAVLPEELQEKLKGCRKGDYNSFDEGWDQGYRKGVADMTPERHEMGG